MNPADYEPCPCGRGNKSKRAKACARCRIDGAATPNGVAATQTEVTEETANARQVTKVVNVRVRTLEDLVRVCEIDTETWDIERWKCGKHETAMKLETRDAVTHRVIRSEPHVEEAFTVQAWLKRKTPRQLAERELYRALLRDIRDEARRGPFIVPQRTVADNFLFEFAPFDLHMGKYTWDEETVTNYDVDIAEDLFNQSLEFLLGLAMKTTGGNISQVLCVFGNDVSHSDNKRGTTTAGTPLDVDSRFAKVYRRICAIHRRAIDRLVQVAPVHVHIVPGNHDELTSFHLGELLAAKYEEHPFIEVYNSPRSRTYYHWGVNLWGFTHGDSERVSELPLAMAREVPELWARCPSREFHIGHKHISEKWEASGRQRVSVAAADRPGHLEQDFFSDKGVRIRRLTSLSGHDYWHTKHAYMDRRACESFIFHRDAGFTAHHSFNVDHFTGKAASK